ncbi:hypothetical protein N7274_15020, partial [Enterococcus faecalis]|uniref:hypothetical protein n=1 Tax=Enterococcus faecalis TaxID=1351 RepID=UPI0021C18D64
NIIINTTLIGKLHKLPPTTSKFLLSLQFHIIIFIIFTFIFNFILWKNLQFTDSLSQRIAKQKLKRKRGQRNIEN